MTDVALPLSDAKRRVVEFLKRMSPATTQQIAERLEVSDVAARQHLVALEVSGLVEASTAEPTGRGRPRSLWSLSDLAVELFPDRHGDLTVELLEALRLTVGEEGIDTLLDVRGTQQLDALKSRLDDAFTLESKVMALADQRSLEGYMAQVERGEDGEFLLIEHHCPICAAATQCQGLCRTELDLFRAALGPGATVQRTEHLLSEGTRCVYLIRPATAGPPQNQI
jgi:predicted ArsR family transcriptional regulator